MPALEDRASLYYHDADGQVELVEASVRDVRPSAPTGFVGLDSLLRRGGLLPGTLTLFGGRTGTRKSTVMLNMAYRMAKDGIPVAIMGLDEQPWQYAVNMMSVMSGHSRDWVEERWLGEDGRAIKKQWRDFARHRVYLMTGRRPGINHLEAQLEMVQVGEAPKPRVIFIDYLKLMTRDKSYGYSDKDRLPRIIEDLQLWSTDTGYSVVVLHQLSRNDEFGGVNNRNAGHLPMTLAQLMYGGEDSADYVVGTYRPAEDPVGNLTMDSAKQVLGDRFDEDDYWAARNRVEKFQESTFVQLLKNRPGTQKEPRGIEVLSPFGESLRMEEKDGISGGVEQPADTHTVLEG